MNGTPILVSASQSTTGASTVEMTAMTPDHQLLGSWTVPSYAQWLIMP